MTRLWERMQVHLALIVLQSLFAGYQIISRVALNTGLNFLIFSFYRSVIALAVLIPFALVLERKTRPPLTLRLLAIFCLLGFLGIFGPQSCFLVAVGLSSAAFGAAFQNTVPVATFIVAVSLGVEEVHFKRRDGKAKVAGTMLCMIGALIMSLYKGPGLWNNPMPVDLNRGLFLMLTGTPMGQWVTLQSGYGLSNWQLGAILLVLTSLTWAFYLTLQAPIQEEYPAPITIMTFTYFFGALQFGLAAVLFERDISDWSLEWGTDLIGIAYSALIASCFCYSLQAWCVKTGGPLLTSVYMPMQSLLGLVMAVILLGDTLYLGSVIGAIITITGLYLVTWGRSEAIRLKTRAVMGSVADVERAEKSQDLIAPLLENGSVKTSTGQSTSTET